LRALWAVRPVEVRVLSGALKTVSELRSGTYRHISRCKAHGSRAGAPCCRPAGRFAGRIDGSASRLSVHARLEAFSVAATPRARRGISPTADPVAV